jgi:hypothetical protein
MPRRGGGGHQPRPRQLLPTSAAARLACAAIVLHASAAVPASAVVTRPADQRLTPRSPEGSGRFGATVQISGSGSGQHALVAAPGENGGNGMLNKFLYDGVWDWVFGYGPVPTGSEQPFPMDNWLSWIFTAIAETDGTPRVHRFEAGPHDVFFEIPEAIEVKALALALGQIALGAPDYDGGRGRVLIYAPDDDGFHLAGDFVGDPGARLGSALAATPEVVVAGAPSHGDNGAAFVYLCCDASEEWVEWQRLDSPATSQTGAEFGAALDITEDGTWIAVGSPLVDRTTSPGARTDVGGVYLFEQQGGFGWFLDGLRRPAGAGHFDHFGSSVAIREGSLVVGSPGEDRNLPSQGAVYVYHLVADGWEASARQRLIDLSGDSGAELGSSVALGPAGVLAGAPREASEGFLQAGAVLFYRHIGAQFADGFELGDASNWTVTPP